MTARTASEIASWDGRLDQQRQNSKWRHSSSSLARDAYHKPQQNQASEPPGSLSDQKRVERSAFRSNLECDSSANSPANARLPGSRLDTTSTSHSKRHYHQLSLSFTAPKPAITSSPFIASSKSSHLTPNSSGLASHVHNSRLPSSRERIALSRPTSTIDSEVIDLTVEDTEDELSVTDVLAPNAMPFSKRHTDPGPSRRPLSSGRSSPITLEQSLFTPPPRSRRRTRMFIDYLAIPPFPKGLTKADYRPMSNHSVEPLPAPTVHSMVRGSSTVESSVTRESTPLLQKRKGKEREHDVVSSRKEYEGGAPSNGTGVSPNAVMDAFHEATEIPLQDDDTYPPLTTLDLAINTRFQFANAWRGHASRLREAELDWMFKFRLPEKVDVWARSVDTSSPRIPGTAGYVSIGHLRPWQLALPDSSPQEKSTRHGLDEKAHLTESYSAAEADANYLSLPDDPPPVASLAVDPTPSNLTVSQGISSTATNVEPDMNQYFDGLSDSPSKHVPPCQQLTPTHSFCPHLLQAAEQAQMNTLGLEFPSFEPDPRLADAGGHECFLGVPPSPTPADMDSSMASGPTPDSPFEPLNYFPASPSNLFAQEAPSTDVWSLEQGEGLLPDNNLSPSNGALPTVLGTIDPSLLGPEKPQIPPPAPTDTTLKRRSKLPELVIYIRRPIDSSTLPLVSGKRPVQIKYRDSGGTSATPSTQIGSNEASSNLVENPIESSTNGTDNSPRPKRLSVPSLKLCEHHTASESDSDYAPETSKSKMKVKHRRRSVRDRVSVADHQGTKAETLPVMSSCHQCRNTTQRPKMLCSNVIESRVCGKRFCNRCILNRYPDVTFDEHSAGFLCPACTNTCNCSVCSRNRGEEYISMRLGGLAASIFKNKVTLVRDVGEPLHRPKSPPRHVDGRQSESETTTPTPEPGAVPTQSQFWAHVYGMEGERMGSAFMTREQMERLRTRGPSHPPPLSNSRSAKHAQKPTRREKKRERTGPRVFVGRPLESWKVRAVRDLEPSVDVETMWGKNKERGSTTDHAPGPSRRRRCYIGKPAPLYEPYGLMPGTASPTPERDPNGELTPMSEVEVDDYWPQPDVGECCSWAPPPPPGAATWGLALLPGLGSGSGSSPGVEVEVEVGIDTDVAADGNEPASASTTALSEEELVRAINAALAALSVGPPS